MGNKVNLLEALPFLVIGAAVLACAEAFLWPAPWEFPMDDAYIHFVYARNLAEHGKLMFNSPTEKGVGTSSPLWVFLLTVGYWAGIPLHILAKGLGIGALILVGAALYLLLRPIWGAIAALGGALAAVLSGPMVWFALSGMETTLFLALGLGALLAYRAERWAILGILLGLLALARPEGLALALAISVAEIGRRRSIPRRLVVAGGLCALIAVPWFLYLYLRTGHFIPTSGLSKHFTTAMGVRLVAAQNPLLALLSSVTPLTYTGLWTVYLVEFVLGGMTLPPPRLAIGTIVGNPHYTLSVWAIPGLVGIVIPLLWAAARRLMRPRHWPQWLEDSARRPWLVFALWLFLHNLAYIAFLPVPGTASRYGAVNHIALWLGLVGGLRLFAHRPRLTRGWAVALLILLAACGVYWNGVYDANLDHMQNVRIAAARFVRDMVPPQVLCAAFDIGAVRYYGERPILDLYGLVDPEVGEWFFRGEMDRYLMAKGVRCLILPDRPGTTEDGWFDLGTILELTTTPLFASHQLALFEIGRDRWLRGYLPTLNYQSAVTVYQLLPARSQRETGTP